MNMKKCKTTKHGYNLHYALKKHTRASINTTDAKSSILLISCIEQKKMDNLIDDGASENIKDFNAAFVLYDKKSPDAKSLWKEGFRATGASGNGMLSLARIELFIKHGLGMYYSRETADVFFRAYQC